MSCLILASTSPYRRAQLERLGLSFTARAPLCDEEALKDPSLPPERLAPLLAEAKARSIAEGAPDAVVIGGDQVACCAGRILGKPGTAERAVEQLLHLAGREHELLTAVCIIHRGVVRQHLDRTVLAMRRLDRAALTRYVASDQPLDCAGAYKLEAGGIALFERIDSQDHSAITGLPLVALTRMLVECGLTIP